MLRIGIVGAGFMGKMHAAAYAGIDGAGVAAVADVRPDAAREIAGGAPVFGSLDELLAGAEVDVVDVCLPTYLHRDAVVAACRAGKHVVCEKPIALSLEDADAMVAAADEAGVQLMVGHCIRFWPEYTLLKEIVDTGRLGRLTSLNLTRFGEFPSWGWDGWQGEESRAGGGVTDMVIHDTDFALYLLGAPESMTASGTVTHRGPDHVFATMRYPGGTVVHVEGGWNLPPGAPFKMAFRAIFERGAVLFDGGPMTIYEAGKDPEVPEFPKMEAAGGGNLSDLGGYYAELKYFVDRVGNGLPIEIADGRSSRETLATVLEQVRQIRA